MLRFYPLVLALLLALPVKGHAGCVRETLVLISQKLSGQKALEWPFQKYFQNGDPRGWKTFIDDSATRTGGKRELGGNAANTYSVTLPDGTTVVTKEFSSSDLKDQARILSQLETWSQQDRGPKIVGVSLLPGLRGTERRLLVVMEDLFAEKNGLGKKLLSGNGKQLGLLRNEPAPARKWLMDRMLGILRTHPDPHPMNVVFRVTEIAPGAILPQEGTFHREGNKIYQAFLVDPSGEEGNPNDPIFNSEIQRTPSPLLQYNHEWKNKYFKRELGLD
ncbi:hypothetical protein EBT16_03695 [bacterium]|nr:hypothetical protein [bacterium]